MRAEVEGANAAGVEILPGDIARGHCSPTVYVDLVRRAESGQGKRANKRILDQAGSGEPIPVLLCPLQIARSREIHFGRRVFGLVWVPAMLSSSGELSPSGRNDPWIPRSLLDPQISDDSPAIGKDDAVSDFASAKRPDLRDWVSYWTYVEALFASVTGMRLEKFEMAGFPRRKNGIAVLDTITSGALIPLSRLYDSVLECFMHPGLLPALAKRDPPVSKPFYEGKYWISRMANRHAGQFGNAFSLSRSQRRAVHQALGLKDGEFLCVTGPPGTGKTTILQSVIASLWVQAAVDERSYPPVIVGTGATNQAVTNIIDAMERGGGDDSLLSRRWLSRVQSYGTFCVSATRAEDSLKIEGYQIELVKGSSFSSSLERSEYLLEAEKIYLANFREFSGRSLSIGRAVRYLARQIKAERRALYKKVLSSTDGSFAELLKSLLFLGPKKSAEDFFSELAQLDQELRYRLFLLSGRFWEGRWLLEMRDAARGISAQRRGQSDESEWLSIERRDWQRRAMLTPLFVSTLAMLPRFFCDRKLRDKPPVDLLIFDEASQVSPEIGAACLSLSSRALVVGDTQQLEPVWEVASNVDRANAAKYGLTGRNEPRDWQELCRKGVLSSNGSLMKWALRCSKYNDGASTIGVFLSEQRRSVPEIVSVSNALAYAGRLVPARSAKESPLLPAVCYFHVEGKCARVGTSRENRKEADTILAWVGRHRDELIGYYQAPSLETVLSVISPFAAQVDYLERRARKVLGDRILIGTVNALQGAERPVVLFSTVYDTSFKEEYFFDRGVNMLNVAVSRAKDSFVVFGNMGIYRGRVDRPSWVLSRFLFADEGNDITEKLESGLEGVEEKHDWIPTLEKHREALRNAFLDAKREIVILSPTISSAAILADRIQELIRDACARHVRVSIYTDSDIDLDKEALKPRAAEGRRLLIEAGAELYVVNGVHTKILAVDDSIFIEGSFNWLSANRRVGSAHQKLETSSYYEGKGVAERMRLVKDEMKYRGFVDQSELLAAAKSDGSQGA